MDDSTADNAVDRSHRQGSPALLVGFAGVLVGGAVALSFVSHDRVQPYITGFLAVLAVAGVFALFAFATGFLEPSWRRRRHDVTKEMIDASAEGFAAVETIGRVIYANPSYVRLARRAGGGGDLPNVERLFAGGADVSEAVYRLAQAGREGRAASEEIRLSPPLDGETGVAWYRVRVSPLPRAGLRRAALWSVADVTREREKQENVFQELRHAIDYLDHAPAGFLSVTPTGGIAYMNATLAGWLEQDLAEVGAGGMTLEQLVVGETGALLRNPHGVPGEVRTQTIDIDFRRRNGAALPVRLVHRVAFGSDGMPGASRTLVLDRTSRPEGLEAQRAAEVRFFRFFHNAPIAIATVDGDGRIVRANARFAHVHGAVLDGAEGRNILSILAPSDREHLRDAIREASANRGGSRALDLALTESERSARLFVTGVDALPDESGEAAIVYAIDTTEQRTLEAQFAQAQKMQAVGELAGGIAHDFNNVLQGILGYADLLLVSHRPTDPSFQDIMQIKQNATRAAGLVRQLLAFSRRQTLRPQVVQLVDMVSDVSNLLRRLLGEKIPIEIRHGRDLWPVMADPAQFEQAILNLGVNARDAMPDGGRLAIRTRNLSAEECARLGDASVPAADYVLVEIEDTGCGIPPDVLDKIFQPFFTTKEVGKGTGLGLSMVYGFVKQSGGFVLCDSRVGEGTTFRILLPRHMETEKPAVAEIREDKPKAAADMTGAGTILLVEDEEAVRAFGARALAQRGYTVLEAASGVEALEVIEEHGSVDLIVSDVVMPEMDGPTLLRELRKRGVSAKIVFVSGYAEEAFRKNLPEGEDFGFLPKPFTLKQLIETVKGALA